MNFARFVRLEKQEVDTERFHFFIFMNGRGSGFHVERSIYFDIFKLSITRCIIVIETGTP